MAGSSPLSWRRAAASLTTLALGASVALIGTGAAAAPQPLHHLNDLPELTWDNPATGWTEVLVDGDDVQRDTAGDPYNTFGGFGLASINNTSNLLLDYKEESPEAYWRMLELLFDKETGAGLNHLKIEMGSDTDTSSGAEPATKRSADEPANVLRGGGFHLYADALAINPDIEFEALRWGEPSWTRTDLDLRYQWYKETIDAAYDTYGVKFTYMSPAQNELHSNYIGSELNWTVEFAKRLAQDAQAEDARYDYSEIKIVALDSYRRGEEVAAAVLAHPDATDWIDAISIHYTIGGGPNLTRLNKEFGMEVLYGEAVAPMIDPQYRIEAEPARGGIGGSYGAVDIADRFINMYRWQGSIQDPAHMTTFLFQPAISALYEGSQYSPKHLIRASDPWSGYYEGDIGIVLVRHFMQFIGKGWEYIENASYGDGPFADGGTAVDQSTRTHLTLRTPADAEGNAELTQVHANNTSRARHFEVKVTDLDLADAPLYVWETKGPDNASTQAYDVNYFQNTGFVAPVRTETQNGVEYDVYQVKVEPYSILTLSTLPHGIYDSAEEYTSGELAPEAEDTVLALPYTDDFEYDEYPTTEINGVELDYVERRGGTPRYTADQNGAFEAVRTAEGTVLQQQNHAHNRGFTWNAWGNGSMNNVSTASPATILGDHRWTNYTASIDFKLDTVVRDASLPNFAGIGVRQVVSQGSDLSPYALRVFADGSWQLRKLNTAVASGTVSEFDPAAWHTMTVEARENSITATLDGEVLGTYVDTSRNPVMAGRISLVNGYYNTQYDNLEITPLEGHSWYSDKLDDTSDQITYAGNTGFNQVGFGNFNRTTHSVRTGGSFTLPFEGTGFNLFGASGNATLEVQIDDGAVQTVQVGGTGDRQTSYWVRGLDDSEPHVLRVAVTSGTFTLDGVDVVIGGSPSDVDPDDRPVAVAEQLDRVATHVGEVPTLPSTVRATSASGTEIDAAVEWSVAPGSFTTPYALVQVNGTFVDNPTLAVSTYVEVVPSGLRYFIDSNATDARVPAGTSAYDAVSELVAASGGQLLNDVADQRYVAADGWGVRGNPTAKAPLNQPVYDKLRETGWYGDPVTYSVTLPAGTYGVSSGHTEWWNTGTNRTRSLVMEVSYPDGAGGTTTTAIGSVAWPNPSTGATYVASGEFTLPVAAEVTYTVRRNGGTESAVLSWLAFNEIEGEDVVLDSLEVTTAPTTTQYQLGEDLDLTGLVVTASYSDGSTEVVDNAALEVSGFDPDVEGEQTVTLTFADGDVTRSVTFTVTVLAPAVSVSADTRCVAGRVVEATRVTNSSSEPVEVVLSSAYGTRTLTLQPERSASVAFSTRLGAVPAGQVSATTSAGEGTSTVTGEYAARSCG